MRLLQRPTHLSCSCGNNDPSLLAVAWAEEKEPRKIGQPAVSQRLLEIWQFPARSCETARHFSKGLFKKKELLDFRRRMRLNGIVTSASFHKIILFLDGVVNLGNAFSFGEIYGLYFCFEFIYFYLIEICHIMLLFFNGVVILGNVLQFGILYRVYWMNWVPWM